jgi:spore germination protein YaaH
MQADAQITDRGGDDHAAVVRFAHQHGISVLLLVNNAKQTGGESPAHTVLADPALRSAAIANLEAYIKKYGLDGVNIDFEMLSAQDRDNLTAFMRELSSRLRPQGYIVSIDVFPKQDESDDLAAAYDYARLADYADKIMLMCYDYHGTWSGPGPIADIGWVENNLKYALRFIPRHKLYLGIAGYGYDWSDNGVESLEYGPLQSLVQRFNATVRWDEPSQSPHFSYTGPDDKIHTVWFENRYSLKFKLALADRYGLAGVSLWKLGQEDPGYWPEFKEWLAKNRGK